MERKFQGIWIPAALWLTEDLTMQEKLFLVEINSLDNEDGCFANNNYFAKFFDISKTRVTTVINNLIDKGFITRKILYKQGTKQIDKRVLKICSPPYPTKVVYPIPQNEDTPIQQKLRDNNTSFNNTINNTNYNNKKKQTKHKFGTYQNVKLTEKEYNKLKNDYSNIDDIINWFSAYIEEKGYKSKSHNLTIRRWVIEAFNKNYKNKDVNDNILEFDKEGNLIE